MLVNCPADCKRALMRLPSEDIQAIMQQAPVGITILRGPEFIVEMANDRYLEIVDRPASQFTGHPLFESLPEIREAIEPLMKQVFATGVPYYGTEFPITLNRFGNSGLAYFTFVCQPLREQNGNIRGLIVAVNEVTSIVRTRESLLETEQQFRYMVMQSPVPMTIFRGPEFVIEVANRMMVETIWRKRKEDLLGKKVLDVFPELHSQKYPELLRQVWKTGKVHREIESYALIAGDDGMQAFYFDYEYAPLFEPGGEISGIMVTVNDATQKVKARQRIEQAEESTRQFATKLEAMVKDRTNELAQANAELTQMNSELERSNGDLEKFAYAASHDMKEPIRKVHFFAELLSRKLKSPGNVDEAIEYVEKIRQAATRMSTLIDDLLTFAQTSIAPAIMDKVDLSEIIRQVMGDLEVQIKNSHATINFDEHIFIYGHESQLRQALYNLINNAVKFRKPGGAPVINITCRRVRGIDIDLPLSPMELSQQFDVVEIQDNGIGFEPSQAEKIFDVFTRLHSRDRYTGSGVGLSIVRRVMEHHGGYVRALSSLQGGALFQLYFPER